MEQLNKNATNKEVSEFIENGLIVGERRAYHTLKEKFVVKLEDLLLELLAKHGPLTRNELVKLTNIPRTTLYDNLAKLISKGLVEKKSIPRTTRGRPKVVFKLKE